MQGVDIGAVRGLLQIDDQFTGKLIAAERQLSRFTDSSVALGGAISIAMTAALAALGTASVKAAVEFESSFAGIAKTVDGVSDEFGNLTQFGQEMAQQMRDLATTIPVNVNEFNRLGEAAGALGIPKAEIADFARVMALLGETTNVASEEAASSIAKIQNIFQAAGKDTDRFASTLVALGNEGASTEAEILSLSNRIASAGNAIGLTQGEVLGFSSAIANVGIEAEAGGSAISRTFIDLASAVSGGGEALDKFAKVAGMSSEAFARAFRDDAASAVTSFIEGLGRIDAAGGDLIGTIEGLGITEIRQGNLLRSLALSGDNLTKSLTLQAKAWQDNSALTAEAEKRFATTAAQVELLWNKVRDVGITIGQALLPAVKSVVGALDSAMPVIASVANAFGRLPGPVQATAIGIGLLAAAIGPMVLLAGGMAASVTAITTALGINTAAAVTNAATVVAAQAASAAAYTATARVAQAYSVTVLANHALLGTGSQLLLTAGGAMTKFAGASSTAAAAASTAGVSFGAVAAAAAALGGMVLVLSGQWDDFKVAAGTTPRMLSDIATTAQNLAVLGFRALRDELSMIADASKKAIGFLTGPGAFSEAIRDAGKFAVQSHPQLKAISDALGVLNDAWVKAAFKAREWAAKTSEAVENGVVKIREQLANGRDSLFQIELAYSNFINRLKKDAAGQALAPLPLPTGLPGALPDMKSPIPPSFGAEISAAKKLISDLGATVRSDLVDAFRSGVYTIDEVSKKFAEMHPGIKMSEMALQLFQKEVQASESALKKKNAELANAAAKWASHAAAIGSSTVAVHGIVPPFKLVQGQLLLTTNAVTSQIRDFGKLNGTVGLMPAVMGTAVWEMQRAEEAANRLGTTIRTSLLGALEAVPGIMQQALTGGGGFSGFAQALGSKIGSDIGKDLGAKLSESLATVLPGKLLEIIPGIGGALGALVGPLLGKLFGPSEESAKVNQPRDQFFELHGGLMQLQNDLNLITNDAARTDALVKAVFQADTAKEFEAAVSAVESELAKLEARTGLAAAAMDKYNLTWKDLQPDAQAAALDQVVQALLNETDALTKNGVEWNRAIGAQRDAYAQLFQDIKDAGLEIPPALQPILDKFNDMGWEAGTAGAEIESAMDEAKSAIDGLAASFSGEEIFAEAQNVVAAIEQIGGASKLTESEMQRVNSTLQQALDKYAAMGIEAPAAMVALFNATKGASSAMSELDQKIKGLEDSIKDEAPEAVMGAVEAQTRAQIADLQAKLDETVTATGEATDAATTDTKEMTKEVQVAGIAIGEVATKGQIDLAALKDRGIVPVGQGFSDAGKEADRFGDSVVGAAERASRALETLYGWTKLVALGASPTGFRGIRQEAIAAGFDIEGMSEDAVRQLMRVYEATVRDAQAMQQLAHGADWKGHGPDWKGGSTTAHGPDWKGYDGTPVTPAGHGADWEGRGSGGGGITVQKIEMVVHVPVGTTTDGAMAIGAGIKDGFVQALKQDPQWRGDVQDALHVEVR